MRDSFENIILENILSDDKYIYLLGHHDRYLCIVELFHIPSDNMSGRSREIRDASFGSRSIDAPRRSAFSLEHVIGP